MSQSPRADMPDWRRSTRCVSDHHCVEVADFADLDAVGLRNSRRPAVSLVFSKQSWLGLIDGIKAGEFDLE